MEQATDYYPFGKSFEQNNVDKNRYLYKGKELQEQAIGGTPFGWYDCGARFYDPELGRWHSVDQLCELSRRWSPYTYAYDNAIVFTDPDGMKANRFNINEPNYEPGDARNDYVWDPRRKKNEDLSPFNEGDNRENKRDDSKSFIPGHEKDDEFLPTWEDNSKRGESIKKKKDSKTQRHKKRSNRSEKSRVQGIVGGFEFNFLFYSINIGLVRFEHDNEKRGLSFSIQSGPGFNVSANFYTGVIKAEKELNYSDLEGDGISYEGGYIIGGGYAVDNATNPKYRIYTGSIGVGITKKSGNAMQTKTIIVPIKAINCENCD